MTSPRRLPVLLVHGWPVTEEHWRLVVPILEDAGFEAIRVTLPGLGVAPGTGQSFRKRDLAKSLYDTLARGGGRNFALIGHDWGATVGCLLAGRWPSGVSRLVVEEEIPPGLQVTIPEPGASHYPAWHGPFNRAVGVAERLVPGREDAYYCAFLRASAGPAGLPNETIRRYVAAYTSPGVLDAALGYYRTSDADAADIRALLPDRIRPAVLAIGGRFAMGSAVAEGMSRIAGDVTSVVLEHSGHYPAEQEPGEFARAVVDFLTRPNGQ